MEGTEDIYAKNLLRFEDNINIETYSLFLSASQRKELAKTCIDVGYSFDWNFNFQDFYKILTAYHYPSLEFLWNLNIFQIMPLETYILNISTDKDILQKFKESIFRLCSQDVENDAQYMTQTGFLSYFVNKSFPAMVVRKDNVKIREICLETVVLLLQGIFSIGKDEIKTIRFTCLFSVWNAGILEESSLQSFCLFALDYYLNLLPIVKGLDAFVILENPSSIESPYHLLVVIEKLLQPLLPDRVSHIITSAVQKSQIDVASLLVVVKAFLRTHQEAPDLISKLVSELMNEAFEKFSNQILLRALLIGYQAIQQTDVSQHISYRLWLQNIFKECGRSKNKNSFSLLIQVLSDIVPYYKTTECLKIAIELNVPIPSEAQITYSDYIMLLKTRIQDLKPSSKPEVTVEKMLSLFESLGKIPPFVMETSLLQKHKFVNEFLPALLVPRVVPPVPDVRERFIDALNKAGKIPVNLLQKYRSSCIQEQNKIISDIIVIDDDFLDEDNDYM